MTFSTYALLSVLMGSAALVKDSALLAPLEESAH